jgi:hypothetical protein
MSYKKFFKNLIGAKEKSFADYFNSHLTEHLKKKLNPHGPGNQPQQIIQDAQVHGATGKLSRIFDEYHFPAPDYKTLKSYTEGPNGLREYMKKNLDAVIPTLLNNDRSALNPAVIKAIGDKNYNAMVVAAGGDEKEVALMVVKGVFVSYGQRVIDNTDDVALKRAAFNSVTRELGEMANEITLKNGLSAQSKPMNTHMSTIECYNMAGEMLTALRVAKDAGIEMVKGPEMIQNLEDARIMLNPDDENYNSLPAELLLSKAKFESIAKDFTAGLKQAWEAAPPKPRIEGTGNLLQNPELEKYTKQREAYGKLAEVHGNLVTLQEELSSKANDAEPTSPKLG